MGTLHTIWRDQGILRDTKIELMKALVFSIVTYGCESWTLWKCDKNRIASFETWVWRGMLGVSWEERSNFSIRAELQHPHRLLGQTQKAQMRYFGHIVRRYSTSLGKQQCSDTWIASAAEEDQSTDNI
eukprot:gene16923-8411_t